MTRILHSSDLHGRISLLFQEKKEFDVWVDTGDFFPNKTRGDRDEEPKFQEAWIREHVGMMVDWLAGRPLISVPGNHDYGSLAGILRDFGANAFEITADQSIRLFDHTFAGFREIPFIIGEWNGETHAFGDIIDTLFETNPTILLTHTPARGILDRTEYNENRGCSELTTALAYRPHSITHHFFGHVHSSHGQTDEMGIGFFNGAEQVKVHEI